MNHKWNLKDQNFPKNRGKVFSCFACGGGSTMGYKLAGFDVIGVNEIDPKIIEVYKKNHNPKFAYCEGIQTFKDRKDLPKELFNLDILDGSPPCSSFSTAGNREKDWGKEKIFREGQACQVLDTLFFDFIDLAKRLQPKVVVAENVKGILMGNAQEYVAKILEDFDNAGYNIQYFVLNGKDMGVPQRRERVFFVGLRKDLCEPFLEQYNLFEKKPFIDMKFNEKEIPFKEIKGKDGHKLSELKMKAFQYKKYGDSGIADSKKRAGMKESDFNHCYAYLDKVLPTITAKGKYSLSYFERPFHLSDEEIILGGTFPQDYDFGKVQPSYLVGMSVPPLMTKGIAIRIWDYWLSKI